ncbi:MAG: zeta toxin family protein [Chitinophagales bacterium]|nr:zeta toxin family protein [Chitinophagales bacterium]
MAIPRIRVFAGPNGSGKSTLFDSFSKKYPTGYFLNADFIENELTNKGFIDLNDYQLKLTQIDLENFYQSERAKSLIQKSIKDGHQIDVSIQENVITDKTKSSHSYEGALISMFLRHHLQFKKLDFCFETVMSHSSKIEEIKEAKAIGYKVYLYFIATEHPDVNISRVENRVQKGGHQVLEDKIESRYYKSLNNLIDAIKVADKSYVFDNSQDRFRLIATVKENKALELKVNQRDLPNWSINNILIYYI